MLPGVGSWEDIAGMVLAIPSGQVKDEYSERLYTYLIGFNRKMPNKYASSKLLGGGHIHINIGPVTLR